VMFPAMAGVKISTLLSTMVDAVTLLKDIPGAARALDWLKKAILNLSQRKSDTLDEDSAFGQLVKAEEQNLKRLLDEFSAIMERSDLDTYEKEGARRRLAAQLCGLLQKLRELFAKYIDHYQELTSIFCSYAHPDHGADQA
jgi:hypothetical protein